MITFSTALIDALDDWEECVSRERERLDRVQRDWIGDDQACAAILTELCEILCVNFRDFLAEEVLVFMLRTYPRGELVRLGTKPSSYLSALYRFWNPDVTTWAAILWRFTGKGCSLFAQTFSSNCGVRLPDRTLAHIGEAIFLNLPRSELVDTKIGEHTLISATGALVRLPRESTVARLHEEDIYEYTKFLSPTAIGSVCQRLLMFRARPKSCKCGSRPGETECTCPLQLELDPSKEYAFVLFRLILERHRGDNDFGEAADDEEAQSENTRWSPNDEVAFLRAACEQVFSDGVYRELYQNLGLSSSFSAREPPLRNPRVLTKQELQSNYNRSVDGDYSSGISQHGGCVARNCKQVAKRDCANVSCKQHCARYGLLRCKSHRTEGLGLPNATPIDGYDNRSRNRDSSQRRPRKRRR